MRLPTIDRARRYLAQIGPAISGSGGRGTLFKAALTLIKGFGLSHEEALALLLEWNSGCLPPWSEKELRAALRDAAKSAKPDGYLLGDGQAGPEADEAEIRRRKRQCWPAMRPPSDAELKLIAALRHVSVEAVNLLRCHKFLWRGRWRDHDSFFIRNGPPGVFCQARRLDGEPFDFEGRPLKALNLPGSGGKFLCPGGLGADGVDVLLIEGAVGLLEAAEFILRAGENEGVLKSMALMAATSAGSRFNDSHLEKLRGRRILILADPDETGREAASAWCGQLAAAGCAVRVLLPPDGHRDFGCMLKIVPASDPIWSRITTFSLSAK